METDKRDDEWRKKSNEHFKKAYERRYQQMLDSMTPERREAFLAAAEERKRLIEAGCPFCKAPVRADGFSNNCEFICGTGVPGAFKDPTHQSDACTYFTTRFAEAGITP